ncbi:MAG: ribosomal RNA methyltransferase RrmJ/FtsJ [Desulfotomaculum sp. 46_296]|nr:MAG: ribosomal RNA methyltransferase RrmJ/FtsJ [Desulfotomaculum sp. 46_296]HAU31106.1 cell division protein FtsJ [Desulfotomaculum sp.]
MINIFLDDLREPPEDFVLVKTVEECIEKLKNNQVDILSLDYDLGNGQLTGYDLVKWLVSNHLYPNVIILHSMSRSGRESMLALLEANKPGRVRVLNRGRVY